MWKETITARVIIKLLLQQKQHQQTQKEQTRFKIFLKWLVFCKKIENIFSYPLPYLHNYLIMIILLITFIIIWHPGISSRFIPPNNNIPVEVKVEKKKASSIFLQLDLSKKILNILYKNKKYVNKDDKNFYTIGPNFFVNTNIISKEQFFITKIEKKQNHWIAYFRDEKEKMLPIILGTHIPTTSQEFFIIVDEEYWNILYPYLKIGMLLVIL